MLPSCQHDTVWFDSGIINTFYKLVNQMREIKLSDLAFISGGLASSSTSTSSSSATTDVTEGPEKSGCRREGRSNKIHGFCGGGGWARKASCFSRRHG